MKSKTEYKLIKWSFQDKILLKKKGILKNINKTQLLFLHINGNYADFT